MALKGVIDGQDVSANVTNAAFLAKNGDDTATNKIALENSDPASGDEIENLQAAVNASLIATGADEGDFDAAVTYSADGIVDDGDNHREAITKLANAGAVAASLIGVDAIGETGAEIANNQSSPQDVVGLLFDKLLTGSAIIFASVRRVSSDGEKVSAGILTAVYLTEADEWHLIGDLGGQDDGVELSITAGGQVQYESDDMSGTGYAGQILFKAITFGV